MKSSSTKAAPKAIAGASSAGITTLCATPCQSTPFSPDCTSAAPTSPPISACDELDGSPNHHVSRFQAIAPSSAASSVCCVENRHARCDRAGAHRRRDRIRRVVEAVREVEAERHHHDGDEQDVFHALPVLDEDRLEDVGRVLASVDRLLELLVDVLPANDHDRVALRMEQLR